MDTDTCDVKACFACVEVLVLDIAFRISVQRVSVICPEPFYVKVRSSGADLFIRRKCYTDRAVRNVLFLKKFYYSKDLSNPCLVVCAQNGGAVGGNQSASDRKSVV